MTDKNKYEDEYAYEHKNAPGCYQKSGKNQETGNKNSRGLEPAEPGLAGDSLVRLIEGVMTSAAILTGAGVCIYDLGNVFVSEPENVFRQSMRGHYCSFCEMVRGLPGGRKACTDSDMNCAKKMASEYRRPFFNTCHAGLTEMVVPVFSRDRIIAAIFIGQCRIKSETRLETVLSNVEKFGGDRDKFASYYDELPVIERSSLIAAANLVDLSMKFITENSKHEEIEAYLRYSGIDRVGQAVNFIQNHYKGNIVPGDVAANVHINKSYLARLFKKQTGMTITDYTNMLRVERAKPMLMNTAMPIENISSNSGFSSQNYFSRIFRIYTGMSPRQYRNTFGRRNIKKG